MTQEGQFPPPPVMWAQRRGILYLTICLEDCKDPTIKIEPDKIYFKGVGGTERKTYELTINLFGEIDPEKTVQRLKDRNIELTLTKKEEGPFWKRLTKENQKFHWLKIDFNKWKDDTDSDDEVIEGGPEDFSRMVSQLASDRMKVDSKPDFDLDMDEEEERSDSDDDEMPDLLE